MSLVGADTNELIRSFGAAHADVLPTEIPEPGVEFAELLARCRPEIVDTLGRITARASALEDVVTDDDLRTTLRPWRVVLDVIGDDGVQLSAAGWMPPATVQRIWHESGVAWDYGKGNREQHTPEVAALREECVRAGLLRKYEGRLQLTKRGVRCRTFDDELVTAIADSLLDDKYDVVQDAQVISLLFVAADWQIGPDSRWAAHAAERGTPLRPSEISDAFWDDVAHMMNEIGWRMEDNRPLHRDDLRHEMRSAVRTLSTGGPRHEMPSSPAVRRIARAALFV